MTGYEFIKGPFQNVRWMIENTQEYYRTKVEPKGGPNMFAAAIPKIVECRGWEKTRHLFAEHFEDILRELHIFYVPKVLQPGPAIVFPLRDVRGNYTLARMKPLYELMIADTPTRYAFLGNKRDAIGPNWLGMTRETTQRILEQRTVNLVEGPFDYLACRLLAPDIPTLSTGTKNFNDMHIAHLRMLGVKRMYLLFDNDQASKPGEYEGAGGKASRILQQKWMSRLSNEIDIKRVYAAAGGDDPSDCLTNLRWALSLRELLDNMRGY